MSNPKPLTPTMICLAKDMQDGPVYRHPGGFWTRSADFNVYAKSYGSGSIEALVSRGIAEYTQWKDGRRGRFPIQAKLVQP